MPEADRADIGQAQPGIRDGHAGLWRTADQAVGQGRYQKASGGDLIGLDAMPPYQLPQTIDAAMRRAAGRERFVAQFADPPRPAEFVERRPIGLAVEQREIAERPGDRRARAGHAAPRQLDRGYLRAAKPICIANCGVASACACIVPAHCP